MSRQRILYRVEKNGYAIEEEVLGLRLGNVSPPLYEEFKPALVSAIQLVRQGFWNPYLPNTDLARTLYNSVLKKMRRKGLKRSTEKFALYPTIGTALDFYHGVDCVFLLCDTWYVTIDISMRNNKPFKADVLVNPSYFADKDKLGLFSDNIVGKFGYFKKSFSCRTPLLT